MRLKPLIFTITGLALAGLSVFLADSFILQDNRAQASAPLAPPPPPTEIVLIAASADIAFGEPIRREDLVPQTWPVDLAPEGAFDSATALLGPEGTAPRRATETIRAGDVILAEKVSEFGATVTIGTTLSQGKRAVAIRVSAETAVGGFVNPGDRVDIVLTEEAGGNLRTGTILQDVRVLAVDQRVEGRGAQAARTITVEVDPRDGQKLVLAQQAGALSLTLRNGSGPDEEALEQITMRDVWGDAEPIPVAEPEPEIIAPQATIRVRRGTDSQSLVVLD